MIPKTIHYCWFGKNPLPESAVRCINSWKKYCPDYEIIEHNEDNYDVNAHPYSKEAYEAGKWAFVSDIARLDILYHNGGIYLDTDVELLKPLDDILDCDGFMGFEDKKQVASGLGMAAKPYSQIIELLLSGYEKSHFLKEDGSYDLTPCPIRNTKQLVDIGLKPDGSYQEIQNFKFFPRDVLAPKEYTSGRMKYFTKNTRAIHHYDASWQTKVFHKQKKINYILGSRIGRMVINIMTTLGLMKEEL